jgi:hypothetical protein
VRIGLEPEQFGSQHVCGRSGATQDPRHVIRLNLTIDGALGHESMTTVPKPLTLWWSHGRTVDPDYREGVTVKL